MAKNHSHKKHQSQRLKHTSSRNTMQPSSTFLPVKSLGRRLYEWLLPTNIFVDKALLNILNHVEEEFMPPHLAAPIRAVHNIVLPPCLQNIFKDHRHNATENRDHYYEVEMQMTEWLYTLQYTSHSGIPEYSVEYDWNGSMLQFNFNHMGSHDIDLLTRDECRRVMHLALVFLHYINRTIPMLDVMLQQRRRIAGRTCQQHLPQLTSKFPNIAHLDPELQPYFDPSNSHPDINTWILCRQLDDLHYTGALPTILKPLPSHVYDIMKTTTMEALLRVHKALFAHCFRPPILHVNSTSTATCTICFERLFAGNSTTMTHCGHFFCTDCHATWAAQSNECAVCRTPLTHRRVHTTIADRAYSIFSDSDDDDDDDEDEEYGENDEIDHTVWRNR